MSTTAPARRHVQYDFRFGRKAIRLGFIMPAVVFVVVMMAFPLAYNGWLSFHEWTGSARRPPQYVGVENYSELFTKSERFYPAVKRTFIFSTATVSAELILGIGIALLLKDQFRGHSIVKTLIILPMVATPVAISMVWLLMLEPTIGVFNKMLRDLNLTTQPFLGSQVQALWVLMVVDVWQWTPMMAMITLAGLLALPHDPYEAALVDGASTIQSFFYITLPLLVPNLLTAVLLRSIEALKTFDIIYTMTRGGPGFSTETLNTLAYVRAFEYFRLGQASALLVVFFFIVLAVSIVFISMRRTVSARQAL